MIELAGVPRRGRTRRRDRVGRAAATSGARRLRPRRASRGARLLLDQDVLERLTASTFPADLAGLPAASVPVGTDRDALPAGLQLVGGHGQEELLLELVRRMERDSLCAAPAPAHPHDLVPDHAIMP